MLIETLAPSIVIIAYLLGSVSAAIIVCKIMGLDDPRTVGSNNPGATNVLRIGGKKAAILTLVGDMLKGLLPTLLAHMLGLDLIWVALTGLAAFLGHLYPIFFGFKGGKGIATGLGVFIAINWAAGLMVVVTWLVIARLLKISSVAGLSSSLFAPFYFYLMTQNLTVVAIILMITTLIFWRHRTNIQDLLSGTEEGI